MNKGQLKMQNILDDGISKDLMNAGRFCFNCEQIFSDRISLEEHACTAMCYICSCGTEFAMYKDMYEHSTTHEPGHQVLDHETIKQRRIEKRKQEEMQLTRLQTGEVIWKSPKFKNLPKSSSASQPPVPISSPMLNLSMQSAKTSQVPGLSASLLKKSFPPNPVSSAADMQNIFAGVGAPTVDLWTLYQPVVLIQTVRQFNKNKPYTCGKCGQCFFTKTLLINHHNTHVADKVSGCVGCGLVLSSRKMVPRFHVCNAPSSASKLKVITAKPLNFRSLNEISTELSQNLSLQIPHANSSVQWNTLNRGATSIQGSTVTPALKKQKVRTHNLSSQGSRVSTSLQSKNWSPRSFKPYSTASIPSKIRSLNHGTSPNPLQCRVCHLPFESAQLLQRHKCAKALEFMQKHGRGGKQPQNVKKVVPLAKPGPVQMNGERKVPFAGNMKNSPIVTIDLDSGQDAEEDKANGDMDDDDCYIVESEPDKPAEMIYQVTSSVPIKT